MRIKNKHTLGILVTIASAFAYGVSPPAARAVYADGGNAVFVALAITFSRAIALAGFCLLKRKPLFISKPHNKGALAGGFLQALGVMLTFSAFVYLPGPIVVVILFSHTLMLLFLMAWRREIRLDRTTIITSAVALFGLSVVIDVWHSQPPSHLLGYILAFISAMIAASRLYVFGSLMKERHPAVVGAETFLIASVFLIIYALFAGIHLPVTVQGYGWLVLTCCMQILGIFGMLYGVSLLGAFQYSLMGKLEPIFTALFSYLLIGEVLKTPQYFGIAIVVTSLIAYQYLEHRNKRPGNIVIRFARPTDAAGIFKAHKSSTALLLKDYTTEQVAQWIPADRTPDYYKDEISCPDKICLVAEVVGMIVGLAVATENDIEKFYVDPTYSRLGIGSALFQKMEAVLKANGHHKMCLTSTITAKLFYQKMGMILLEKTTYQFNTGIKVDVFNMEKSFD